MSTDDVNLAERIFKADVPTCKGKGTKPKPPIVTTIDKIELPPELDTKGREVELAIYIVFINNEAFLHTKDRTIKFKGISTLGTY